MIESALQNAHEKSVTERTQMIDDLAAIMWRRRATHPALSAKQARLLAILALGREAQYKPPVSKDEGCVTDRRT